MLADKIQTTQAIQHFTKPLKTIEMLDKMFVC